MFIFLSFSLGSRGQSLLWGSLLFHPGNYGQKVFLTAGRCFCGINYRGSFGHGQHESMLLPLQLE